MATTTNPRSSPGERLPEAIASRDNRWIKLFHAALAGESSRKARQSAAGTVGVEGARLVETAVRSEVEIPALLFSTTGTRHLPRLSPWIPPGTRLLSTTDRLFAQIAGTEVPQR